MNNYKKKNIWLIGASSGIGASLARNLSNQGATLILSARSEDKLNALKEELGAHHHVMPLDITDADKLEKTAQSLKSKLGHIDSAILLAGSYEPTLVSNIKLKDAQKIVDINLIGAFNFLNAIVPIMKFQKYGQIVLTSSVAGYRGLPKGQPYSATKAAIKSLAESLRAEEKTLDVRLISPGFVETPMTDKNDFDMPMVIKPEKAADHIAKGLLSNSYEIHFPKTFTYVVKFLSIIPNWLYFIIAGKMMDEITKEADKKNQQEK